MLRIKRQAAFTIVELLIVIVIIAILAAISVVAYRGIQDRARESTVKSDLSQAAKQLHMDKALSGAFPTSIALANGNKGLSASTGTIYSYTADNTTNPPSFCLSATNGNQTFQITQAGSVQPGVCGDRSGGGAVASCASLSVGDAGQAGGIIFYKETTKTPNRCYEVAPSGWYAATAPNEPKAEWGCYGTYVDMTRNGIGEGRKNTDAILASGCLPYNAGNLVAANIATGYNGGSASDWYLPSRDELKEMLKLNAGYESGYYLSSTQSINTRYSGIVYPGLSNVDGISRSKDFVRPIRSFTD